MKHDWECISNPWTSSKYTVQFRCKVCGKVEGLFDKNAHRILDMEKCDGKNIR